MGLILIAKVYFEQTYENFVPNIDRTYKVLPIYEKNGVATDWSTTSGAIAHGIKKYSPVVEAATRYTGMASNATMKVAVDNTINDSHSYSAKRIILADSCFFDFFSRNIYAGNAKQVLAQPSQIMISRSFAEKLGGNKLQTEKVLGIGIIDEATPSVVLTVGGIYEDFPKNSSLTDIDIIISLPSIGKFMGDGSERWQGNDRYCSFVRLKENASAAQVEEGINLMCKQHINLEYYEKSGIKYGYRITPLSTYHSSNKEVKKMCNILLILALAVLVTSVLNYVLISISAMVRKAKIIAVYKCYGATRKNIYSLVFSEAFAHLLMSLVLASLIAFALKDYAKDLIGTNITSLLSSSSVIMLFALCTLIFVICGLLPGMGYSRIPVATAFRRYKESNRRWKHALLFVQFIASSFFITLLPLVILQYHLMLNTNTGYSYSNLIYIEENGVSPDKKNLLKQEIERLPFVAGQTFCCTLPMEQASGNNIYLPNDSKNYLNVADLYNVDNGYLKLMEIPIIEGQNFNEQAATLQEVMVSRKFANKMKELAGWNNGPVGKGIRISEHCNLRSNDDFFTICGVYDDFLIGYIGQEEERPSILFHSNSDKSFLTQFQNYHLIKLKEVSADNMKAIEDKISALIPNMTLKVKSYANEFEKYYVDSRRFRDSILISGLVVLIITIIGLIGYSHDEINRRRSEIAVRKINGATVAELQRLFLNNITKITGVAVVIGGAISYMVANKWLEQFSQKISLSWWIFALCALLTAAIVIAVVAITTHKAANTNPVENLKNE